MTTEEKKIKIVEQLMQLPIISWRRIPETNYGFETEINDLKIKFWHVSGNAPVFEVNKTRFYDGRLYEFANGFREKILEIENTLEALEIEKIFESLINTK